MLSLAADQFKHQYMVKNIAIKSYDGDIYCSIVTQLHKSLFLFATDSCHISHINLIPVMDYRHN